MVAQTYFRLRTISWKKRKNYYYFTPIIKNVHYENRLMDNGD